MLSFFRSCANFRSMQKFWILAVVFAAVFYAYFRNSSEDVLEELEEGWETLQASNVCRSLLKKHLSRDVFDQLKHRRTSTGATLLDVIQSGIKNLDSGVGVYAPDAESYTTFDLLFEPIINEYHGTTALQPAHEFGDLDSFTSLDSDYVLSTRIRCARNLQGYTFSPLLTEKDYQEMEYKIIRALTSFDGDLNGTYYPLTGMEESTQTKLVSDHFLFKQGDRFLQAANACRFWPTGRGIFHNKDKTFLVWVNEEDHLRIISMQSGGDLKQVYRRLVQAVKGIESRLPFSHDDELGFLTFCPTNLGTTIRASVHIRLPYLAKNIEQLQTVAAEYNLQVRGIHGEHSESEGGVFDISNKRRMGLTEYEAVKDTQDGVQKIIELEKKISEDSSKNWF